MLFQGSLFWYIIFVMKKLTVNLENKCTEITVDRYSSGNLSGLDPENSLLVTDETMYRTEAARELEACGIRTVVLGPGEKHKTFVSVERIIEEGMHAGLDRGAVMIGLGGGVICDMTAFAASVYMRGCRLVLMPTTLLSMVDASIGGKTGVDFLDRKNIIGSFYPAERVLIYTDFLKTLPEHEFKSGLAELIKHGFLAGDNMLDYIDANKAGILDREPEISEEAVYKSLAVKAGYIEKDFRETGCRAHLNLGHTFGHALETAAGLGRFTHGEAVAWGIHRAMKAGLKLGITDNDYAARVEKILREYGYDIDFCDFDHELYMQALASDKKKRDGKLRYILQVTSGETVIESLDDSLVKEVIEA